MNILITGGAGFLGSHLCDKLIEEGHKVYVLDNLITGMIENLEIHRSNRNFEFIYHDVSRYIYVSQKLDWVIHFASPASPIDYLNYPIQTLKVGSLGTHNALGLAMNKHSKFLFASTSEVYGDPLINPQPESYWGNVNPIGPRGCYDESKRFGEALTTAYHNEHGLNTRIARIFNTHGERMRPDDGRVVSTFINQALKNEPLSVFGDGSQTRSIQYVSDLIEGIFALMNSDINTPVNIGNPQEISILDLAKLIIKLSNSKSDIIFKPLPEDDPKVRRPDISFAKQHLNWEPVVGLEEGLLKSINWYIEYAKRTNVSKMD
ncbi:MAG: UDP-glucuronic acid decarboxylase family protein [Cyanobacteriota bacterium]